MTLLQNSTLWEKGRDLTQSYDKGPTPTEMSKGQSDNKNNATKKFDYIAVSDRLRTVSWSNYSHPTGVVRAQPSHSPQQPCNQNDTRLKICK